MASFAMMVGGVIVNALAFSGSNFLFSSMRGSEQKRHNKAVEQLEKAQSQWAQRRMERLDFIHEELHKEGHSIQTFKDVESAMHEYFLVYGKFYTPSEDQKNREVIFVIIGLPVVAIFSYTITTHKP